MTFDEALAQLRTWCALSQRTPIEIEPGVKRYFQSIKVYDDIALDEMEAALNFRLPLTYRRFMSVIGESVLFDDGPSGGGLHFYSPSKAIEMSQSCACALPECERFCWVGAHMSMADLMGFCIDRPGLRTFDVFCHEYEVAEYVAISDELKSWREFGEYITGVVERFGRDSL